MEKVNTAISKRIDPRTLNSIELPDNIGSGKDSGNKEFATPPLSIVVSNGQRADGISGFVEQLIRKGVVSAGTVQEAVRLKKSRKGEDKRALFLLLIEEFNIDREQVYAEFTQYYSFKTIDLASLQLDVEAISFINKALEGLSPRVRDLTRSIKVLPLRILAGDAPKLQLVSPDPTNPEIPAIAKSLSFSKYEVCYISLKEYEELFRQLVIESQSHATPQVMEYIEEDDTEEDLDEEIRKGHLAELIDNLLSDAVRVGASDIHIVPKGIRKTEVHFRVDGRLKLWNTLEDCRAEAVSAVIKEAAKGPDRFERMMAQDGFIQRIVDGRITRFRVSIIPIMGKDLKIKIESIVIRVLSDPEDSITVESLGFSPYALERFKKAISKPHGLVILTGPTGSGKSTTLLAAVRAVMDPGLNIITVEDPVEYFIEGTRQVKLNPKLDFEGALRAILRHDPDIVMVGEIRDKSTADLGVKLANTGHLTFSTLHTNDAPSVIARLYKMGVEPFLLAYAVNIIVAQRLMRKLCPRCKVPDTEILPQALARIGFPEDQIASTTFYRPIGCMHCIGGYKGRKAIHEVLYFTKEIRKLILEAGSFINEDALRELAVKQGMTTLREAGIELLKQGITTIEEVGATTTDD